LIFRNVLNGIEPLLYCIEMHLTEFNYI